VAKQRSIGKCSLCGEMFGKAAMTRHLTKCSRTQTQATPGKQGPASAFHLVVEGGWKVYWLQLSAPVRAPLSELDGFLRRIWLECCGHMSAFEIAGIRYSCSPMMEEERGMETPLGRVLDVGTRFSYEYDFGSTTELELAVVGFWNPDKPKGAVQLLARNEPPPIICGQCKSQPATEICTACEDGCLCEACAAEHDCGEEMFLPVANSPRVGVCAYTG
jgi:hypothetical protein